MWWWGEVEAACPPEPHRPEEPVLGIVCGGDDGLMAMEAQHRLFAAVRPDAAVRWGRDGLRV